jgi:flagellar biosynthesis anti-sigma factor FlgM
MTKPRNQGDGTGLPPGNRHDGNGAGDFAPVQSGPSREADAAGYKPLIDQARHIIEATPEIRPEKLAPLKEAVEQGTYKVDTRKLANALITKLLIEP